MDPGRAAGAHCSAQAWDGEEEVGRGPLMARMWLRRGVGRGGDGDAGKKHA